MGTRCGVTCLLVTLLSVSDGRRNFEETSKQCPKNFECVHRSVCEQYNQRYAEYKRTNNAEIKTELKALICNKRKRAVCCRQEQFSSSESQDYFKKGELENSTCGKPQKIPESVNNSYRLYFSAQTQTFIRLSMAQKQHLVSSLSLDS